MAGGIQLATAYVSMSLRRGRVVSDARRELNQVERATSSAGTRAGSTFASRFTGHVRSMGARVGSIVAGIGRRIGSVLSTAFKIGAAGLVAVLGYSLKKGFERLSSIDQATHKLAGLGNSGKQVSAIMDNALKSVKGTAFGLDEAATTAAGAVAAGVKPGKNLTRTLSLTADAATIAGTSMGDMGAIFNKVATSNKIQGDVIAQLSDKGIPIVQLLAKTLHKSAGEVVDLASAGKINFAQFQKAMEAGLGGAAKKSGDTFTGAFANLKASLGRIGANLLSGIFPQLAPNVQKLTTALGPLEDRAKGVGVALGKFLNKALVKLPPLITRLRGDWQQLKDGFTYGDLGNATTKWSSFGATMKRIVDALHRMKDGDTAGVLGRIKDSVTRLAKGINGANIKQLFDGIGRSAPLLNASLKVTSKVLGFLADHAKTVGTFLPVILALVLAGKAANATFGPRSVIGFNARTIAIAANATASLVNASATRAATAAEQSANTTRRAGIITMARQKVATIASTVAEKAATAARKAGAIAQRLLNVAMRANPIGLVITGLLLLGAGFVLLWKKSETFRRIVTGAWNGIKAAALAVKNWFTGTLWPAMHRFFGWVTSGFDTVRSKFSTGWAKIKGYFSSAWNWVKGVFARSWSGVKNVIMAPINWIRTGISREVGKWKRLFTSAKDGIGRIWGKVKALFEKPITATIQFMGAHFSRPINSILSKVGLGKWSLPTFGAKTGGILPGYTPGRDVHRFYSPTAGELDLSGGEAIMRPEVTSVLGSARVHALNAAARLGGTAGVRRVLGFAGGGIWGGVKSIGSKIVHGVEDVWSVLTNPKKLVTDLLGKIGDSWPARVARGALSHVWEGLKNIFGSAMGGPGGGGAPGDLGGVGGRGWQWQWGLIHRLFPSAVLTSAYRPGARVAAGGGVSYHALGRAIDVGGSSAVMAAVGRWILKNFGSRSHDLIHTPLWGTRGIYNGHWVTEPAVNVAMHRNHVHWGYAGGGIFPARRQVTPPVFDHGGTLAPGINVVNNQLGRPERLVRVDDPTRAPAVSVGAIYAPSDNARQIVSELSWAVRTSSLPSAYGRP